MKIVYVSGVRFGLELLQHILDNKISISAIFSYNERKSKNYSDAVSFDKIAKKHHIKHIRVNNINDKTNIQILQKLKPDLIFVMGWSQILGKEILSIPKIGCIGSHPTELPKYRGRAPIPWTILRGLKKSALTFFWLQGDIDSGDIFIQRRFRVTKNDNALSVYKKITQLGKNMILYTISNIEKNRIKRKKQDPSKFIEYWPKRNPEDGLIEWNQKATEIDALIRATTHPYPGAFTIHKGSKMIIWKARISKTESHHPGKIMSIRKNGVVVGTKDNSILLQEVSFNNKSEKATNVFSNSDIGLILGV